MKGKIELPQNVQKQNTCVSKEVHVIVATIYTAQSSHSTSKMVNIASLQLLNTGLYINIYSYHWER